MMAQPHAGVTQAAGAETPRVALHGTSPGVEGTTWESDRGLRVGRLSSLEVFLPDESVSRQHAELVRTAAGWVVRDQGSTNGTFVNGNRLGRAEERLREGDVLQFGDVVAVVKALREAGRVDAAGPGSPARVVGEVLQSWEELPRPAAEASRGADPSPGLMALLQIGRALLPATPQAFYESVLWQAAEALDARHGAVVLREPGSDRLTAGAAFSCGSPVRAADWLTNPLGRAALDRGQSLLGEFAPGGAFPSVVCALLRSPHRQLGVLCLARGPDQGPFREADLRLADALALSVSVGIDAYFQEAETRRHLVIQTLTLLTQLVALRGDFTGSHAQRVTDYALVLAEELGLPAETCASLRVGTPLIGLGKIGLPDALLLKGGPLTADEVSFLRGHLRKAVGLLEAVPDLVPFLPIVRSYTERWDGSGYPDRLRGEQIPLPARIVGLAVAFDAMTSDRPYRRKLTVSEAFAEVRRLAGTQFDPRCVEALLRLRPRIEDLLDQRDRSCDTLSRTELRKTREKLDMGAARRRLAELGRLPAAPRARTTGG